MKNNFKQTILLLKTADSKENVKNRFQEISLKAGFEIIDIILFSDHRDAEASFQLCMFCSINEFQLSSEHLPDNRKTLIITDDFEMVQYLQQRFDKPQDDFFLVKPLDYLLDEISKYRSYFGSDKEQSKQLDLEDLIKRCDDDIINT